MNTLDPGSRLGAYRIIRPLGAGGMGHVYEVEHEGLRIRRALKVFTNESEHRELLRKRFVAEGRILADLLHPRIVRVYDFAIDEESGTPYFAMDYIASPSGDPQTLEDACRAGADEDRIAGWFRDICEGLAYIHSKGIVHRDVSIDNILIDREGRAVLTDFGIARITGETYRRKIDVTVTMPLATGEHMSWGKGLYLAPEMKSGAEATPYSDAYALGVVLFRLLAGSWYTPDTRLDDALAGMDYNWAEVIARLCDRDFTRRLDAEGFAGMPRLLRKCDSGSESGRFRVGIWLAIIAAAAVLASAALAWCFRSSSKTPVPVKTPSKPSFGSDIVHIVDVTNYHNETVYHIVPVTAAVDNVEKILK